MLALLNWLSHNQSHLAQIVASHFHLRLVNIPGVGLRYVLWSTIKH